MSGDTLHVGGYDGSGDAPNWEEWQKEVDDFMAQPTDLEGSQGFAVKDIGLRQLGATGLTANAKTSLGMPRYMTVPPVLGRVGIYGFRRV
jgi:hypothetical protein